MKFPEWAITHKAIELAIDNGAVWDQTKADQILKFATETFRPQFITGKFTPLEWQSKWLQTLYAVRDSEGNRLWKYAILHTPKKCGKTLLTSLVCLFELLYPSEQSPQIYSGSVSQKNAMQVFDEIAFTLRYNGYIPKHAKIYKQQKHVNIPALNANYYSVSSDGDRQQGLNSVLTVLDEAAWHKNDSLWDSMRYAHIARKSGCCVLISTASDNPTGYYHGLYEKAKRLLKGEDLDPTWFPTVYEMSSPEADPEDPKEWYRAVPSLGVSYSEKQFALDLESAKNDPAEWPRFLRYRLNRWVKSDETKYFDVLDWDKGKLEEEPDLTNCDCTIGVDTSQTVDPTAVVALFDLGNGETYVKAWSFVCREGVKLRERTSLPKYKEFAEQGCLEITDGDMIDPDLVLNFIIDLARQYQVRKAIFDPTGAAVFMLRFQNATGVDTRRMTNSFRYMNAPMKALRIAMKQGKIKHDGKNNFYRYNLDAVRLVENRSIDSQEIRPSVKSSTDHIDLIIATLNAYSDMCEFEGTATHLGGFVG